MNIDKSICEAAYDVELAQKKLFSVLQELGIETSTVQHDAVFTVAQSQLLRGIVSGGHCKSLFLKNKSGDLYLLIVDENKRTNINQLSKQLQAKRFSFASSELLFSTLGVRPGSATPFGLINDTENKVLLLVDEELLQSSRINFHPLVNTSSTSIAPNDLIRFAQHIGNTVEVIKVPSDG